MYLNAGKTVKVTTVSAVRTPKARVDGIKKAMKAFSTAARLRTERAVESSFENPPYGLCWEGELLLAQLMDPSVVPDDTLKGFLASSLERNNPFEADWYRICHMCAAIWRMERVCRNL